MKGTGYGVVADDVSQLSIHDDLDLIWSETVREPGVREEESIPEFETMKAIGHVAGEGSADQGVTRHRWFQKTRTVDVHVIRVPGPEIIHLFLSSPRQETN